MAKTPSARVASPQADAATITTAMAAPGTWPPTSGNRCKISAAKGRPTNQSARRSRPRPPSWKERGTADEPREREQAGPSEWKGKRSRRELRPRDRCEARQQDPSGDVVRGGRGD